MAARGQVSKVGREVFIPRRSDLGRLLDAHTASAWKSLIHQSKESPTQSALRTCWSFEWHPKSQ